MGELTALCGNARGSASALSAAVEHSLTALAGRPAAVEALHRLGRRLSPPEAVPQTALETLAPLTEIYTMQCERDVHARLCGAATAAAPAASPQSLEDIFF